MAKKKNERIDESLFNEEISTTVEKNNFNKLYKYIIYQFYDIMILGDSYVFKEKCRQNKKFLYDI